MLDIAIAVVVTLVVSCGATYALLSTIAGGKLKHAELEANGIRDRARLEAENKSREIENETQRKQLALKEEFEKQSEAARRKLRDDETRLDRKEETLERKENTLLVKEKKIDELDLRFAKREKTLTAKEEELEKLLADQRERLLQITNLTPDQAKAMCLARIEDECKAEAGDLIRNITERAQEEAKDKARQITLAAIQRYAAEQTCDHTVSTVVIPSDDMKGRVIGREGRNIRSFEKATGVDVIIDDTPGMVVVSCFDPVRRQIARLSLEKLVQDGRIHPARIEEVVNLTTKEMDDELLRIGKEAAAEANIPNLPKPIIPMLGRLGYRTSYGQNVLKHSLEVAFLSQSIAGELGLDSNIARRAGFLHDIGKAMDHEQEGGHPQIGKDFLKRFGESEAVLNAAEGHHGDVPPSTPYTLIVMAADAISASRPGARRESLERYVKRLQELEDLAMTFEGVRQAYAIQAGREIRVIVDAKMVDDKTGQKIARDIAKKIEANLTYPGEIKVTLLRETRAVEYAR
jgi:ribonuclease Y